MWHCGTLLCGRQRRTSKHRENEGIFHISFFKLEALLINEGETTHGANRIRDETTRICFDVSCQIIVCLTHCIINMDTKGKRRSNWTMDEEMLLIEQSKLKDEELFGKMKGSGDVKASTRPLSVKIPGRPSPTL